MPKYFKTNQGLGFIPIVILIAAAGILLFLFISNTFEFKDRLFSILFPKPPSHAAKPESSSVPDEILLKFKPGVSESARENIRNSHGIRKEDVIEQISVERGKVPAEARDRIIEALNKNPNIEYAEPNYLAEELAIPNDQLYQFSQWNLQKIDVSQTWDISKGNAQVVVAVVDSGVKSDHEDLTGKILPGYNFVDENTNTSDISGHGTMVTGIVGATTNNSIGVASLGWKTPVMPLRVVDSAGFASYYNIEKAVTWAADKEVKVINISLAGSTCVSSLQDSMNYAFSKGIIIAAASGNFATIFPGISAPANCKNVIAVGGTTADDRRVDSSSFGIGLDVMAPGQGIWSTQYEGSYGSGAGTSFSTPHVAALAALLFVANPSLTVQQVVDIILSSSKDLGDTGWDQYYGCGRIDAAKALQMAFTPPSVPTCMPSASISTPTPTLTPTQTPTPTPTPTPTATSNPVTNTVVISNISSSTTANAATIKWTTNVPATSRVEYGLTTSLGSSTTEDTNLTTNHSVTVTGLTKQTRYYYKVHSKNSAGLETSSSTQQLRTKNR